MPPALEQGDVQLRFMPPKPRAPNPRLGRSSFFGHHDFAIHPCTLEIKYCEPVKVPLFAWKSFSP
jgi:hypothetical protein